MTATMNREAPTPSAQHAAPAKPEKKTKKSPLKSKKFLILLLLVVVVGGAAYKMLMPAKPVKPSAGDTVAMDATTLNLTDGHYLQIALAVQLVKGKESKDSFQTSPTAELVIDEFSNRTMASLSSNPAREKLMDDLQAKIKKEYPGMVWKVYLTKFVMQ